MILVVDSGSYKSDWMFQLKHKEPLIFRTKGINPFFATEKEIIKTVQQFQDIKPYIDEVTEIYYFGSGCTSPDRREIVSNALSHIFPKAFICIDNDVIGSAYATCGSNVGLIATLGTGSNITFFDGNVVQLSKQGLGFVLGDIGSGAWFGKKLVSSFLYETMPEDLAFHFGQKYALTKEQVIEHVYQRRIPNVYLASFAPFLTEHRNHPFISTLIHRGFERFVEDNIYLYPNYKDYECHFVGSIAYQFSEELKTVCELHKINVGKILKQPVTQIYQYVLDREEINLNH